MYTVELLVLLLKFTIPELNNEFKKEVPLNKIEIFKDEGEKLVIVVTRKENLKNKVP